MLESQEPVDQASIVLEKEVKENPALPPDDELLKTVLLGLAERMHKIGLVEDLNYLIEALIEAETTYLHHSADSGESFYDVFYKSFFGKVKGKTTDQKIINLLRLSLEDALEIFNQFRGKNKDFLTQLPNRQALEGDYQDFIQRRRSEDNNQEFSLIVVDIDDFKKVNDEHGHLAGDMVLKFVADSLQKLCRRTDGVYRYGGEEFVIIAHGNEEEIEKLMVRILEFFRTTEIDLEELSHGQGKRFKNLKLRKTVSLGAISSKRVSNLNFANHFDLADVALYSAKEGGRNQYIQNLVGAIFNS
ncbi:MAG: GGDEF domain-containing protein [Patescibacteria group bacterium]